MFNSLKGRLSGHNFPLVFLDTNGVEWQLEVSATTFQSALAADREQPVRILTYLQVREDIMKLFGFWSVAERTAFLELITVPGVGPRQALRILSGTTVRELTQLLEAEDVPALTRIPGLGTKTAQKMILQLKGHLVFEDAPSGSLTPARGSGPVEELLAALVEMGFERSSSKTTLEHLAHELLEPGTPMTETQEQELFRRAIRELSR